MVALFLVGLPVVVFGIPIALICAYYSYQNDWTKECKPRINPTAANTAIKIVGHILLK